MGLTAQGLGLKGYKRVLRLGRRKGLAVQLIKGALYYSTSEPPSKPSTRSPEL